MSWITHALGGDLPPSDRIITGSGTAFLAAAFYVVMIILFIRSSYKRRCERELENKPPGNRMKKPALLKTMSHPGSQVKQSLSLDDESQAEMAEYKAEESEEEERTTEACSKMGIDRDDLNNPNLATDMFLSPEQYGLDGSTLPAPMKSEADEGGTPIANPYERLIVRFGRDCTVRWSCRQGDILVLVRCEHPFADIHDAFVLVDCWCMRDGDWVTFTNRATDLPSWFKLHASEVGETLVADKAADEVMQGPTIWRLRTGDRVAWVGDPGADRMGIDGLLAILDCQACALALGEMTHGGLDEFVEFGVPLEGMPSIEDRARGQVARRAIELMGVPDSVAFGWQFE